jgi:hypothetical protein
MYSALPSFVLGFHGCDESVATKIFAGKDCLQSSNNDYDWLGHGVYFWENNPKRAMEYAEIIKTNPERCKEKITKPAVVGAIIDLGHCLNLLDSRNLELIKQSYEILASASKTSGIPLPVNKSIGTNKELLLRHLDCAVVEFTHFTRKQLINKKKAVYEFDTVRGVFVEGEVLYPNAGFNTKNHIQVCVRNPNCIKGYFRVLQPNNDFCLP